MLRPAATHPHLHLNLQFIAAQGTTLVTDTLVIGGTEPPRRQAAHLPG
ncbi:MAG: hypothetical protein ACYC9Y_09560 [Candidatus Methylomirabilia bacterium]